MGRVYWSGLPRLPGCESAGGKPDIAGGGGGAGMPRFTAGSRVHGSRPQFSLSEGLEREFLAFRRARLRGRSNTAGKRDLREGLLKEDLNNSEEKALRSCLPKRGVCGHRIARDGVVPVPLDTGCTLSETVGRRWKGERKQLGSKCYSRSVLSCWSWTSKRSISLAQVRAQHWMFGRGSGLGEGTWKRKT